MSLLKGSEKLRNFIAQWSMENIRHHQVLLRRSCGSGVLNIIRNAEALSGKSFHFFHIAEMDGLEKLNHLIQNANSHDVIIFDEFDRLPTYAHDSIQSLLINKKDVKFLFITDETSPFPLERGFSDRLLPITYNINDEVIN